MIEHPGSESPDARRAMGDGELTQIIEYLIRFQERHLETQNRILRRDQLWRNVRVILLAIALVAGPLIYSLGISRFLSSETLDQDYVALVRISGLIAPDSRASAANVIAALDAAYEDKKAKGVVLLINSPGGTPVQAAIIHDRIRRLKSEHPDKRMVVVGEDMLTSGAYLIACAADEIYVNRATFTGSIGVIVSGWGLDKLIERFQIERRVFTAGEHKSRLDTFRPLEPDDRNKTQALLGTIHQQFIQAVRDSRGERLTGQDEQLFSGDFWSGEEALALGLVDGLSDLGSVLRDTFQITRTKDYTRRPSVFERISNSIGTTAMNLWVNRTGEGAWLLP